MAKEDTYELLDESWGDDGSLTIKVRYADQEHQFSWAAKTEPSLEKAEAWLANWVAATEGGPPPEEQAAGDEAATGEEADAAPAEAANAGEEAAEG